MEKYSENEAVTFTFPAVDFEQKGSYFCEYQKKLPSQVIYYPQGNVAELSVIGKWFCALSVHLNKHKEIVWNLKIATSIRICKNLSLSCSEIGDAQHHPDVSSCNGDLQPRQSISHPRQHLLCHLLYSFQLFWRPLLSDKVKHYHWYENSVWPFYLLPGELWIPDNRIWTPRRVHLCLRCQHLLGVFPFCSLKGTPNHCRRWEPLRVHLSFFIDYNIFFSFSNFATWCFTLYSCVILFSCLRSCDRASGGAARAGYRLLRLEKKMARCWWV